MTKTILTGLLMGALIAGCGSKTEDEPTPPSALQNSLDKATAVQQTIDQQDQQTRETVDENSK